MALQDLKRLVYVRKKKIVCIFRSVMIRLILDYFDDLDGEVRLKSSFKQVNNLSNEIKSNIIERTLWVGKSYLDKKGKEKRKALK